MKTTPLHAVHRALGAKMAAFAGYDMPIQYADGVLAEHLWTRENAGVFDVSHMGQVMVEGSASGAFWDSLTPSAISTLAPSAAKYTVLMNEHGGVIDDLIVTRLSEERFFAVINAGCKEKDIAWLRRHVREGVKLTHLEDRALIALQGPKAQAVLKDALEIDASNLPYMHILEWGACSVSRVGYTGEDGFEITMPNEHAEIAWTRLMRHPDARPIGLAARDSLRLEMGYPLYGHDLDETTSPVEAGLGWIIRKTPGGYPGEHRIQNERSNGVLRKRGGIRLTQPGIAREGAEIFSEDGTRRIGTLTSGGFSPTLQVAIAQGYIETDFAKPGTGVNVRVRGRDIAGIVSPMPFVPAKTRKDLAA